MKKLFVVLLALCVPAMAQHRLDDSGEKTVTIFDVVCSGSSRALVVCIAGDRVKSVKYGERELYELANELSISGHGHAAIFGLQLDYGKTSESVVVEVSGDIKQTTLRAYPLVEATVEDASDRVFGILALYSPNNRLTLSKHYVLEGQKGRFYCR